MNSVPEIVAIICTIGLPVVLGMYLGLVNYRNRHKENMELIKLGIVPTNSRPKPKPSKYRALRNGFLCVGISLGILVSIITIKIFNIQESDGVFWVIGLGLFFLGLSYLVFYYVVKDKDLDE